MSKTKRVTRRSAAEWTALLEACERSGLSRAAFAVREGIHPGTFAFWGSRLAPRRGKSSSASKSSAFLPVSVRVGEDRTSSAYPAQRAETAVSSSIEVVLANGRRVRCALSQASDPRFAEVLALAEGGRSC
jgi:hypothetical protein